MDLLSSASSSDSDDNDNDSSNAPPIPNAVKVLSSSDPAARTFLHRSQPHVRGWWAVHVYLNVDYDSSRLGQIQDDMIQAICRSQLQQDPNYLGPVLKHDDWHVSLHRRVAYVPSASVASIVTALTDRFQHETPVVVTTRSNPALLLALANDSQTRVFYALPLQPNETLVRWHSHVATVLAQYSSVTTINPQQQDDDNDFLWHVSLASVPKPTTARLAPVSMAVPKATWRVTAIQVRLGSTQTHSIDLT